MSGTQWYGGWPLVMVAIGAMTAAGIEPRIGRPRLWGTVALGAATALGLQALITTVPDLVADNEAGVAEWPEYAAVGAAVLASMVLLAAWVAQAVRHGRGPRVVGVSSMKGRPTVSDPEVEG